MDAAIFVLDMRHFLVVQALAERHIDVLERALLVSGLKKHWWDTELPLLSLSDFLRENQRNVLILVDLVHNVA